MAISGRIIYDGLRPSGCTLHIPHRVLYDALLAQREQAVSDIFQQASLCEIDLLAAPLAVSPIPGVGQGAGGKIV